MTLLCTKGSIDFEPVVFMNKNLLIVGRTRSDRQNITSLFLEWFSEARRVDSVTGDELSISLADIIIFASSAGRFPETLEHCRLRKRTLIIVSSGIKLPADFVPTAPVIMAPNLALLICALFEVLPQLGVLARRLGAQTQVVEAHQASKASAAVTASRMAEMFGVPEDEIGHIRSDAVAGAVLSVPSEYLGGFAQHFVAVTVGGVKVTIRTEIVGRDAYAEGLKILLGAMEKKFLKPGVYDAHKLVFGD